jgi:hypothetical protein
MIRTGIARSVGMAYSPKLNDENFNRFVEHMSPEELGRFASDLKDNCLRTLEEVFSLHENQRISVSNTKSEVLSLISDELSDLCNCGSRDHKTNFHILGLNPENCPGLPIETVRVRRELTDLSDVADIRRDYERTSRMTVMRGHKPIKPDPSKPTRPKPKPKEPPKPKDFGTDEYWRDLIREREIGRGY